MRRKGHIYSYILILPAFFIAPSIYGVIYSLTDWTIGKDEISFIGFENYRTILQSEELQLAIYNTFLYAVVVVIGKNLNGLLLALAVNTKMKLRGYFRVIFFLPCVISTIIIGLIFVPILHPNGIFKYHRTGISESAVACRFTCCYVFYSRRLDLAVVRISHGSISGRTSGNSCRLLRSRKDGRGNCVAAVQIYNFSDACACI